jgi:hypothetical protein
MQARTAAAVIALIGGFAVAQRGGFEGGRQERPAFPANPDFSQEG